MDADSPAAQIRAIEEQLRCSGRPERAAGERRYLKSDLDHLGVGVPAIRRLATATHRARPRSHDALVELVEALWARPVHELRLVAVELLRLGVDELSVADVALLERLLRQARTWALVDPLAIGVVGALAERDPARWDPVVRRWATDPDRWLRRASLLAHLPALRRSDGDFARFGALADSMLDEREFFIRKAIGWVLREAGKRYPDVVTAWLLPRAATAAGLTVREAVKYLPERDRRRILDARST